MSTLTAMHEATTGADGRLAGDSNPVNVLCRAFGLPLPVAEYRFNPPRRWRFDYSWPNWHIALEIEGGAWVQGRHTRGAGYVRDMEKYNTAALLGWRVFRCTPDAIATALLAFVAPALE